ncbi:DMT family transporter [Falsiroseomonas ponticola]|uniref:DMT family transporter n=1 Tax=Falsiroseomonas ponticola TaxID=2786951 RepID=UPI0019312A36|nr:DMT family transporter [Roseomonas ponticola]
MSSSASPGGAAGATAFACVAVTVLLWASAFPSIRAALQAFPPAELAALRFAVASLALGLHLAWARPALPGRADLPRILAAGGLGIAAYNLLLNSGSRVVDAGTASFLVNTAPVFAAILGAALLGERLRPWGWVGIGLSVAGVALIAAGRGEMGFGAGALLVLAAALCQAAQFVLQKPLLARRGALPVTACLLWAGTAMLLPFLPGALATAASAPAEALGAVIFLGLGPAALAYVAWSHALSRLPVGRAASFLYLVPPVATLIAWAWLGEAPGWGALAGGAVALAGVVLVNTIGRAPAAPPSATRES